MARSGCVFALVLLGLSVVFASPKSVEAESINLGTASRAGVYFPVGSAICRLVNRDSRDTGVRCEAVPSKGSADNIANLRNGDIQIGIVQADVQFQAFRGEGPFTANGAFEDLRALFAVHSEAFTVVANAESGIAALADLEGKRVAIGLEGSGARASWAALAEAFGWPEGFLGEAVGLPSSDQAVALCDKDIDAFFYPVGHPSGVIKEATIFCETRIVPISGPVIDELIQSKPYFGAFTIPSGLYSGTDSDVATFGIPATVVTRADLPDETALAVVQAVFGDLEGFRGLHPVLKILDAKAMLGAGLAAPFHPAAEKYYAEQSLLP